MSDLEATEIDVLMEALDRWAEADPLPSIMGALVSGIVPEGAERDRFKEKEEAKKIEEKQETRVRKERAILIQAKLIGMRDAALAESIAQELM